MFKKLMSMTTATLMLAAGLTFLAASSSHATASNDASLNLSTSTIKGAAITSAVTSSFNMIPGPSHITLTLSSAAASDTTNAGSYQTVLTPNESHATVTVKKFYTSDFSSGNFDMNGSAWLPTATVAANDWLVAKVVAQDGTTINYYGFAIMVSLPSLTATHRAITMVAPVIGANPVGGATDGTSPQQWMRNSSTSWSPNDSTFQAGVSYTATLHLGTMGSYDFSGLASSFFTVSGASSVSATYSDPHNATVTVVFPTLTASPSPSPSPSAPSDAEAQAAAARAAAEAARVAAIAKARTGLVDIIKVQKPATLDDYKSADYNVKSQATVDRINKDVLALQAKTPTVPLTNDAIKAVVAKEGFVDQISTLETQGTVLPKDLVAAGVVTADNKYKTSILLGLQTLPTDQLNTYEKVQAAVAAQLAIVKARADRLAAGKARLAKRLAKP